MNYFFGGPNGKYTILLSFLIDEYMHVIEQFDSKFASILKVYDHNILVTGMYSRNVHFHIEDSSEIINMFNELVYKYKIINTTIHYINLGDHYDAIKNEADVEIITQRNEPDFKVKYVANFDNDRGSTEDVIKCGFKMLSNSNFEERFIENCLVDEVSKFNNIFFEKLTDIFLLQCKDVVFNPRKLIFSPYTSCIPLTRNNDW